MIYLSLVIIVVLILMLSFVISLNRRLIKQKNKLIEPYKGKYKQGIGYEVYTVITNAGYSLDEKFYLINELSEKTKEEAKQLGENWIMINGGFCKIIQEKLNKK